MITLELGQKIRNFRKRAGLSQFDLEIAIGASAGSMSRIENGEVNPTKETILQISKILNLTDTQVVDLFYLDTFSTLSISKIIDETISIDNLQDLYVKFVESLSKNLNYMVVSLLIFEQDSLIIKGVSMTDIVKHALNIIGWKSLNLIPIFNHSRNLLYRAAVDSKIYESKNFEDFTIGVLPVNLSKIIGKFSKTKTALAIPIFNKEKSIGSMYIAKPQINTYEFEMKMLLSLGRYLAMCIERVNNIKI